MKCYNEFKYLISNYKYECILFLFWISIHILIANWLGLKIANDSYRYISLAFHWNLNENIPTGKHFWYITYVGFLTLFFKNAISFTGVILIQIFISGLSCIALYSIGKTITKNRNIGYLAVFFYLLFIEIHSWNFYILTESMYVSIIILSFLLIIESKSKLDYLLLVPFIVIASLIRPTGYILLLSFSLFLASRYWYILKSRKYLLVSFSILSFFAAIVLLNMMLKGFNIMEQYKKGEVIFATSYSALTTDHLYIPSVTYFPIWRLIQFILFNPIYFFKLALLKTSYFIIHAKPYYSFYHNLYILILFPVMYFFSGYGIIKSKINFAIKVFSISFILFQIIMVALTVEDWDGRFLAPLIPFISLFAAIGLYSFFYNRLFFILRKIKTKRSNRTN